MLPSRIAHSTKNFSIWVHTQVARHTLKFKYSAAWLALFAAYLALAIVATYPLTFQATNHVFGLGTPPLNIWALSWVNRQLVQDPLSLFDGNVFFPYPRSLAFSEHLFVPSLLAAPWLAVSNNPVLAHNAVSLISLALAGVGMFLLCRELTGNNAAAFVAGMLYAFHTWNINELIRLQILSNQWFPFLLHALLRFFRHPSPRRGVWVGLTYALQSLSCMYWALYLPLVCLPTILLLQVRHRLRSRKLLPLAVNLGWAILVTAIFFVPYLKNSSEYGFHREEPNPVPVDRYFDVLPGNLLYSEWLGTARANENAAHFLGFTALGLGLIGLFACSSKTDEKPNWYRPLFVFFIVAGFFLSLGTEIRLGEHKLGPGPYAAFFRWVPGFRSVRYPERLSILLILGLAPMVAIGLDRLSHRLGKPVVVVLGGILFLEHLSIPLQLAHLPTGDETPEVYRWIAKDPGAKVVAEVPTTRFKGERADADPMYYSTVHWKRTVQGFTGHFPPAYNFLRWRLFHFPDQEAVSFLEKLGVDTVVVHPDDGLSVGADPRWTRTGPTRDGDILLRLNRSAGLQFTPLPDAQPALLEIDPEGWKARTNLRGASRAIDGDPTTFWSTETMQREHYFIAVSFPSVRKPARISMMLGDRRQFPMRFEVLGLLEDRTWARLPFDRAAVYERLFTQLLYDPLSASVDVELREPRVWELMIRITETDGFELPWSISEIRVFEKPE